MELTSASSISLIVQVLPANSHPPHRFDLLSFGLTECHQLYTISQQEVRIILEVPFLLCLDPHTLDQALQRMQTLFESWEIVVTFLEQEEDLESMEQVVSRLNFGHVPIFSSLTKPSSRTYINMQNFRKILSKKQISSYQHQITAETLQFLKHHSIEIEPSFEISQLSFELRTAWQLLKVLNPSIEPYQLLFPTQEQLITRMIKDIEVTDCFLSQSAELQRLLQKVKLKPKAEQLEELYHLLLLHEEYEYCMLIGLDLKSVSKLAEIIQGMSYAFISETNAMKKIIMKEVLPFLSSRNEKVVISKYYNYLISQEVFDEESWEVVRAYVDGGHILAYKPKRHFRLKYEQEKELLGRVRKKEKVVRACMGSELEKFVKQII